MDDLDALRLEKNDLDWSLTCFGMAFGEAGKGGREVMFGEEGMCMVCDGSCIKGIVLLFAFVVGKGSSGRSSLLSPCRTLRGEVEVVSEAVGEVMVLLTGDAGPGSTKDKEVVLGIESTSRIDISDEPSFICTG